MRSRIRSTHAIRARDVGTGDYAPQLSRWLRHFPRERLLVMSSEAYFADPDAAQVRIHEHLGLDPVVVPSVRRNWPGIDATAELLGIDLPWLAR